jgi:hypothetical protein
VPKAASSTPSPDAPRYLSIESSFANAIFREAAFFSGLRSAAMLHQTGEMAMAKSRFIIVSLLLALAVLGAIAPARADQAFQRLMPLLIDLDGWQGKKPDGMSMEMPGGGMTTATREYQKGSAKASAAVMTGQAAAGALSSMQSGMNVTTSEGHVLTDTMQGMKVMKTYATSKKTGALMVAIDKDAMFSFSYNGLAEDEALALAQKFDWKAIQAAAKPK